jgi:hypothetical protein
VRIGVVENSRRSIGYLDSAAVYEIWRISPSADDGWFFGRIDGVGSPMMG